MELLPVAQSVVLYTNKVHASLCFSKVRLVWFVYKTGIADHETNNGINVTLS